MIFSVLIGNLPFLIHFRQLQHGTIRQIGRVLCLWLLSDWVLHLIINSSKSKKRFSFASLSFNHNETFLLLLRLQLLCYYLINCLSRTYTYDAAAVKCASLGGRLPEIKSSTENQYLQVLLSVNHFTVIDSYKKNFKIVVYDTLSCIVKFVFNKLCC